MLAITIAAAGVSARCGTPLQPSQREEIVDPHAYAIYSLLVPRAWAAHYPTAKGGVVLQRETTVALICNWKVPGDPEWTAAGEDFRRQNTRTRVIRRLAPGGMPSVGWPSEGVPYRLMAQSEIEADDVRWRLQHPGRGKNFSFAPDFVAVSAIGFNVTRTKAVVYVRVRDQGYVSLIERRGEVWDQVWRGASPRGGCHWGT